jgi:REP element-mobilizing transposase RayT
MPAGFKVYEQDAIHFITSTVIHWIPVFNREDYFQVLADSFRHCIESRGLQVHSYVFMPNHFHAICSQPEGNLSHVIGDMKRYTSRQITKMLETDARAIWLRAVRNAADSDAQAKVWNDAFHPEQVYSEAFFQQKCDYIHSNPVRAGFVDDPSAWKYSSAGFYYRDIESIIPITPIEW